MNRLLVCLVAALAFAVFRTGGLPIPAPLPSPVAPAKPAPIPALAKYRDQMTAVERAAMADCYAVLSKAVAANPQDDPVIHSTAALSEVHRAALLFVWRGVLANPAGKYEGLRGELEGLLRDKAGTTDIPLNPAVQRDAASLFDEISRSFR